MRFLLKTCSVISFVASLLTVLSIAATAYYTHEISGFTKRLLRSDQEEGKFADFYDATIAYCTFINNKTRSLAPSYSLEIDKNGAGLIKINYIKDDKQIIQSWLELKAFLAELEVSKKRVDLTYKSLRRFLSDEDNILFQKVIEQYVFFPFYRDNGILNEVDPSSSNREFSDLYQQQIEERVVSSDVYCHIAISIFDKYYNKSSLEIKVTNKDSVIFIPTKKRDVIENPEKFGRELLSLRTHYGYYYTREALMRIE